MSNENQVRGPAQLNTEVPYARESDDCPGTWMASTFTFLSSLNNIKEETTHSWSFAHIHLDAKSTKD